MTLIDVQPAAVSPSSDTDLLAAVARGGRDALGELVRRYVDFVYAAAVRQLGDTHAAEDVTQAVFLVLAKKAGRVEAPALASWLHRTTVYAANNARRAARRRKRHELAAARPEADMTAASPDAATREVLARLDEAIAKLPAKDHLAVCGRYLRGEDLATVAATLNTTPAAAQKRIERAVETLRRQLSSTVAASASPASVTPAVLLGALAVAAPSPANAAPAALATASASPAAVSTAKGVIAVTTVSNIKIAAGLVAVALAAGLTAEAARRYAAAPTPPPAGQPAPADGLPPAARAAESAGATATFPDGVQVALIAIGDPMTGQWWTPDGKPTTPPDGADNKPEMGKPDAGERRLSFVTEIRGTAGQGNARGRLHPKPERLPRFNMWTPQLPGPIRRSQTDIIIDAASGPVGFHVDVTTGVPRSLTLLRGQRADWAPFAEGDLTSPGGITYTLAKPQLHNGKPAFEISPYDAGQFLIDNLDLVLIGPGGEEWPCVLDPIDYENPPRLRAWSTKWTLPEVSAARMTLRRYDRGVDFTGFAMRPNDPATPTATGYTQSGPRDPGR